MNLVVAKKCKEKGCDEPAGYRCQYCKPCSAAKRKAREDERLKSRREGKVWFCRAGCGAQVSHKGGLVPYCDGCKVDHKKAIIRACAARARLKKGSEPTINHNATCKECGITYSKRQKNGKYCAPCRREVRLVSNRERARIARSTPEGREAFREYFRKRGQRADVQLSQRMKGGIRNSLNSGKQGRSWREMVPYSLEDLMEHLERQFVKGMTWDNRDQWHIDHIRPLASFEFSTPECDGFQQAWALTNLRPLWATENRVKSAKRLFLI